VLSQKNTHMPQPLHRKQGKLYIKQEKEVSPLEADSSLEQTFVNGGGKIENLP
jgi:hypothetical protein